MPRPPRWLRPQCRGLHAADRRDRLEEGGHVVLAGAGADLRTALGYRLLPRGGSARNAFCSITSSTVARRVTRFTMPSCSTPSNWNRTRAPGRTPKRACALGRGDELVRVCSVPEVPFRDRLEPPPATARAGPQQQFDEMHQLMLHHPFAAPRGDRRTGDRSPRSAGGRLRRNTWNNRVVDTLISYDTPLPPCPWSYRAVLPAARVSRLERRKRSGLSASVAWIRPSKTRRS